MRGFATIEGEVTADNINLSGWAEIKRNVIANNINLSGHAEIKRNVIAKVINFKNGFIGGDVDADEIINDSGWIKGDVNTIKIEKINGSTVDGKITYKC